MSKIDVEFADGRVPDVPGIYQCEIVAVRVIDDDNMRLIIEVIGEDEDA